MGVDSSGTGQTSREIGRGPSIERYSVWFLAVVTLFITCLIVANIIATKLISLGGYILPAAVIVFPLSYIVGDVLTEVYGFRAARRVIWLGFFCNLLAVLAIYLAQILPAASFWTNQEAYEQILGSTPRVLFASFIAYLIGEFANSAILSRLKILTHGRWLWSRTIGSTLIGQGLDSVVFISIVFIGTIPAEALFASIVAQWLVKSAYEAIATPATYFVVGFLKRAEGIDTYDYQTSFNPLAIGD